MRLEELETVEYQRESALIKKEILEKSRIRITKDVVLVIIGIVIGLLLTLPAVIG